MPSHITSLTLKDAVVFALCNNRDTRVAGLRLHAVVARSATTYSTYFPAVEATYGRTRTTTVDRGARTLALDTNVGLSVDYVLYDFGQRELRVDAAEALLRSASHSYNATYQTAIASAVRSYYSLLRAQEAIDVVKASLAFAKEGLAAAILRNKVGQASQVDVLQAQSGLSQATLQLQSAENILAQEQMAFALMLGVEPSPTLAVSPLELNDALLSKEYGHDTLYNMMEKAKDHRQEMKASREGLNAARNSQRALERSTLASITGTAGVDLSNDHFNLIGHSSSKSHAIGINVSIPLFSGFSHTYSVRAGARDLESQELAHQKSAQVIQAEVWNAWHNHKTAIASLRTSRAQLQTALVLKDGALERYKEGLGTIIDVLSAQAQYSAALQSELAQRYNVLVSRIDLIRSSGTLDIDSALTSTTDHAESRTSYDSAQTSE